MRYWLAEDLLTAAGQIVRESRNLVQSVDDSTI